MSDFKNQQEVWAWLAAGNKGKFKGNVIGFKDGFLFDFTNNKAVIFCSVTEYDYWFKHIEPVYEYQWLYKYKNCHANTTSVFYKSEEHFLNYYIQKDLEWYECIERTKRGVK